MLTATSPRAVIDASHEELLTVPEVAAILRISTQAVYRLIREGRLPAVRLGRGVRVDHGMLRRWIESGGYRLPE